MDELKGKKIAIIGAPAGVGAIVNADIARCEAMGAIVVYAASVEAAKEEHKADLLLAMPARERQEINAKDMGALMKEACINASKAIEDLSESIESMRCGNERQSYNNRYAQRHHRKSRW